MIGVGHILSVTHKDTVRKELHGHSYQITAWFESGDMVGLQKLLKGVVRQIDHTTLPDEMSRAEDIALWIGKRLPNCKRVDADRPLEMLFCWVEL